MLILALESSAKAASVALVKDGALLAQYFQNSGLTHSRTLLPMAEDLLRNTETSLQDLDRIAVAYGPGSFTGIRIGVSAAKGLAWGADLAACGVSTLEAMAWNGIHAPEGTLICATMDARRNQIYNALFRFKNGTLQRLSPDRAISLAELGEKLQSCHDPIFILGDGTEICGAYLEHIGISVECASGMLRWQNAWGVAMAAMGKEPGSANDLLPVYLRLSQAERERQERLKKEQEKTKGEKNHE